MAKSKNKSLFSTFGFRLLLVTTLVTLSLWGIKNYVVQNSVLGTAIIADRGSDSSGPSDSSGSSVEDENDVEENENETEDTPDEEDIESQLNVEGLNNISFETESHSRIRLENRRSRIEISNEDDHLRIRARHEDGTEIELEDESLDEINEELEDEDFEISTDSGGFRLRHGLFEAQTHFPLSINPTTNELTVTTPAGTKVVAILPDAAVNNLIRQKFITVVASSSADTGITLGLFENESTFEIKGLDKQKFLGFFPVDIDKIIFVSTENGEILNVNQSLISRLLDFFSAD